MTRWQSALRRPDDDTIHVLPASRHSKRREVGPASLADRYVAKRGRIEARSGLGAAVGPLPRRETGLDGLARGEHHVVIVLEDDDV